MSGSIGFLLTEYRLKAADMYDALTQAALQCQQCVGTMHYQSRLNVCGATPLFIL